MQDEQQTELQQYRPDKPPSPKNSKKLAEAALFTVPRVLSIYDLAKILGVPVQVAREQMAALATEFNSRDSALEIVKPSENAYKMKVRDAFLDQVSHLAVDPEFSKATLRTLGLIAVKQPVRQSTVVKIVGNKAYDYIKELSEKGFIKAAKCANTKLLSVTPRFETYFGKKAEEIKQAK